MIYEIKITLQHSKPPIWRKIEVSPDTALADFHYIIQTTMGWENAHLHHFRVDNTFYTPPSGFDDFGEDYSGMKLKDVLEKEGQKIQYEYDFGDSWGHEIKLEKIKDIEKGVSYPRCTKGKRACPPEDCGGVWGYMELEAIMKDKKHPSYKEMYDWLGGELESEAFDMDEINEELED